MLDFTIRSAEKTPISCWIASYCWEWWRPLFGAAVHQVLSGSVLSWQTLNATLKIILLSMRQLTFTLLGQLNYWFLCPGLKVSISLCQYCRSINYQQEWLKSQLNSLWFVVLHTQQKNQKNCIYGPQMSLPRPCKAFTLQGELTSTKVNLTESIRGLTRRYNWVLLLK